MKNRNAFRGGSYALAISAVVLAILVVVNIFASALPPAATRYDISAAKLYSITSNTKVVVNALDQDVTIYWVVQSGEENQVIENLLSNYNYLTISDSTASLLKVLMIGVFPLVSLISRLYDVTSGSVKVGGEDVRGYDLETLRNQVAVVLQKNVLFSGTVLDNLRWGRKIGSTAEYQEACCLACADEFIECLPKGYDAWVERGGANFSGGQKQRLCIATLTISYQQYGSPHGQTHSARHGPEGALLPPGRDKACAGQPRQGCPSSHRLKAVETLGMCP